MSDFKAAKELVDKIKPACSIPKSSEITPDNIENYLKNLDYDEDRIREYLGVYRLALELKKCNEDAIEAIANAQEIIKEQFTDSRSFEYVKYPLDVVAIVCILAFMAGRRSAFEIADYWEQYNPYLQVFISGMPAPDALISQDTVRTVLTIISPDLLEEFFIKYFANNTNFFKSLKEISNLKSTLAVDGQEVRASYRKGEASRKKKGAVVTSLCNCEESMVCDYKVSNKKNQEKADLINMIANVSVEGSVIMADALNTTCAVMNAVIKAQADFLLPIKSNHTNKKLTEAVKKSFQANTYSNSQKTAKVTAKGHGRLELSHFYILSADTLPKEIADEYPHVKTLVKYIKIRDTLKNKEDPVHSERYYVSSLAYDDVNIVEQIKHSIGCYWNIEAMHNRLDLVLMQDYMNICDPIYLPNRIGFNKIVFNILTYQRELASKGRREKKSYDRIVSMNNDFITCFKAFCKYFIDCNKKYPPMTEQIKRIKNIL